MSASSPVQRVGCTWLRVAVAAGTLVPYAQSSPRTSQHLLAIRSLLTASSWFLLLRSLVAEFSEVDEEVVAALRNYGSQLREIVEGGASMLLSVMLLCVSAQWVLHPPSRACVHAGKAKSSQYLKRVCDVNSRVFFDMDVQVVRSGWPCALLRSLR